MDAGIAAKMGLGLVMIGVSTAIWFGGYFWPWGWVIGIGAFCWGLFSIGDTKSKWGDYYN